MTVPGRSSYEVRVRSSAPPDRVFALLEDAAGWSRWAGPMVPRSWWEREGDPPPGGVGAIRRLGLGPASSREEIVAYDPPRHLGYVWLTSFPTRDYRADVWLEPDGAGTRLTWSGSFTASVPGTAGLVRRFFVVTVGGFARRLASAADF